jgi:6-pyruvoyl-tetrahydropterin synthase-like protein
MSRSVPLRLTLHYAASLLEGCTLSLPVRTKNASAQQSRIFAGKTGRLPGLFPIPALVIGAVSFAVIVPTLFLGNASGHDFEFHLNSWMEVVSQWQQGILYPRWAALAHFGYGEARFVFYPPASWMLGAVLGAFLPWVAVAGAYIWIALAVSGISMFFLARQWLERRDAIFAAALYAANPYYVVIVYWRSAFAELLAGALLPLLLLYVLRLDQQGRHATLPLALVVAGAWLTNAPAAVMLNYSLALLLVVAALVQRSPKILLYGGLAIVLGAALASFYVLPAAYEERWVNIAEVLSPGVRPQDNFLFTWFANEDHNRFNRVVSVVAVAEMAMLAVAVALSRRSRGESRLLWRAAATWGAAASLLMWSPTLLLWQYLPKLRFVQLPWRWLLCLNVAFTFLVTMSLRRWISRAVMCLAMLAVLLLVWHKVQSPWWDGAEDIQELQDNVQEGPGYEGTDEYVPIQADPYEIKKDARRVVVEGGGRIKVHITEWAPESKFFLVDVTEPAKLVLRLFNYPAWRVEINGHITSAETEDVTGQMTIPVGPGENRIRLKFVRTWDRTAGAAISALAVLLVLVFVLWTRHERSAYAAA